mmetsp:Transcript_69081/g.133358  ORF Transcript_69081/g.133358 Transcript_69081/m.133358 type:complete len:919 (-) Transcript_69081:43-2799(-)
MMMTMSMAQSRPRRRKRKKRKEKKRRKKKKTMVPKKEWPLLAEWQGFMHVKVQDLHSVGAEVLEQRERHQQQQQQQQLKHPVSPFSNQSTTSGSSTPKRGGNNTSVLFTRSSMARGESAGPRTESTPVMQVAGFRVECPKVPKQARQQRDRCAHWGPEPIGAEHLSALKESWKVCVPERLYTGMFSDRMDDQLPALQSWRVQVTELSNGLLETLDMLLKWLTWMLLNTNTQVWRLTLEVLSSLLERLASEDGIQLSDREAQILMPNILERSGHNMPALREFMQGILKRSLPLYPRLKMLPMVLHGTLSKNKRSAAVALRFLAEMLDRPIAAVLVKSQKDLGIISKLMDDKDGDVRRTALHAVACLSQHVDAEVFERMLTALPKLLQTTVRAAASRMSPAQPSPALEAALQEPARRQGRGSRCTTPETRKDSRPQTQRVNSREVAGPRPSMSARAGQNASFLRSPRAVRPESPVPGTRQGVQQRPDSPQHTNRHGLQQRPESPQPTVRRAKSQQSTLPSPQRRFAPRAVSAGRIARAAGSRLVCPRTEVHRHQESLICSTPQEPIATVPCADEPDRCGSSLELAVTAESDWTTESLTRRLLESSTQAFQVLCGELRERSKRLTVEEAPPLAEAIISAMKEHFGSGTPDSIRLECLVGLIDDVCSSRDCLNLPVPLLRQLLLEQLRHLQHSSWSRHIEKGPQIARTLNLSCVLLMTGIRRCTAYDLMLDIGTNEPEAVHSTLILKCLKKMNKNIDPKRSDSKRCDETEASAVIEVVRGWVQKAGPKIMSACKLRSEEESHSVEEKEAASAQWRHEASLVVLLEGVKEVIETVVLMFPSLPSSIGINQLENEVSTILQEWNGKRKAVQGKQREDKENQHHGVNPTNRRAASPFKDSQGCITPVRRRLSSPAKLVSPCMERN